MIEETETARGFRVYGEKVTDLNGGAFEVVESSLATEAAVRIYVDASSWDTRERPGVASLHLNETQVRALRDRLAAWLEEIPTRGREFLGDAQGGERGEPGIKRRRTVRTWYIGRDPFSRPFEIVTIQGRPTQAEYEQFMASLEREHGRLRTQKRHPKAQLLDGAQAQVFTSYERALD